MKLLKISLISFLAIFSFVLSSAVFAEDDTESRFSKISSVTIDEAKIISQDENGLRISFVLKGGDRVESGIKYGISILDKDDYAKIDEVVFPEILTLEKDVELEKEMVYQIPFSLDGDYYFTVKIGNKNGPLSSSSLVDFSVPSGRKIVEITPGSCYFYKEGDEEKTKVLDANLLAESEDPLILYCQVNNLTQEDLALSLVYEEYLGSLYGEKIAGSQKLQEIILLPEEKRFLDIPLPWKVDVGPNLVRFMLEKDGAFSNSVIAKYSIPGRSSTVVNNVSIDKSFYKKGEEANLSVIWSSSLPEIDLILKANILNKDGENCLLEISSPLKQRGDTVISGSIIQKCINPNVLIKIEDAEGNILAEDNFIFESIRKLNETLITDIIVLALIIILVVAGIIIFFVKPKNKKEELKNNEENIKDESINKNE
jgi:hypothetical protein